MPDGGAAGHSEEVDAVTLDGVLETSEFSRVDVLKVDVEGAEAMLFAGAGRLFERRRPEILLEINGPAYEALGLARTLHRKRRFDLVHHARLVNCRAPSFLGRVGIPFVWFAGAREHTTTSFYRSAFVAVQS